MRATWGESLRRAALLAVALLAAACQRRAADDVVVIATAYDAKILLPAIDEASDASIDNLLYLSLNSARLNEGTIEYLIDDMSLAERWEYSADSTALTYYLKPGARWSDGEPIEAADVVFTYDLIHQPEVASRFGPFWTDLDSVVALDPRRVTFFFRRRNPEMLLHSGVGIMPAHIYRSVPADYDALARQPGVAGPGTLVVSGPFQVANRRPGESFELRPNPLSIAGPPDLDRVVFRIVPDDATRVIELERGDVDLIYPTPLSSAPRLAELPGLRMVDTGYRYYEFVAWNGLRFEPFNDPRVRHALSLAIDREGILAGLGMSRFAVPAAGPASPLFPDLVDPAVKPDPYLPDSAAALLAGAGWRDSDGDGVLDKEGMPFRFALLGQSDDQRRRSILEVIQAQLADIGIAADLKTFERSTLFDYVFDRHDFQAALAGWEVTLDPSYMVDQFWPDTIDYNITRYSSVALDSLVPAAQAAGDARSAARAWRAVGAQIAHDRPYAFLWFYTEVVGMRDRISDYRIDFYSVYQNLQHWKVRR